MPRQGPRAALALLVAASLVAVGVPVLDRVVAESNDADGSDLTKSFVWHAPENLTGTFAAEIQMDIAEDTRCNFLSGAEGTVREDIPLIFWASIGTGGTYLRNSERVHAHAGGVDSGPATPWDYGAYGEHAGQVSSWLFRTSRIANYTIAAFGIENRPDQYIDDGPMAINITCDKPVDFSLRASRQAVGFTEQSFTDGGAGLSVYPFKNDHLIVQRNATVEAAFGTEMVRVKAQLTASEKPSGTVTLDRPNGTESWELARDLWAEEPDSPWGYGVVDGPGDYTLELSVADRIEDFGLPGVLTGLNPVDSLDDVAETCDPNNPLGEPVDCIEV